ncbi:hypothetical protein [Moorena producens]|uniref:hypothetical protein n=1 Tax=Moorena producens TaxID=1155739 RepID=UPI0011EA6A4C|nr:hypothetical protein [Moorena producens]
MAWESGVEQASCLFQLRGIRRGTGILPVSTSGHLAVEQASCLFQLPGGQDAHPTHIHPTPQQCQKNAEVDSHHHFCLNPLKTLD